MILTWSGTAAHIGTLPLVFSYPSGGAGAAVKTQRGNIDFDQVRTIARQGTGALFQMFNGSAADGDALIFDANGNAIDAGAPPVLRVATPAHHNSAGIPGQMAFDAIGNFYWCYAPNSWAQMGAAGYSNSF